MMHTHRVYVTEAEDGGMVCRGFSEPSAQRRLGGGGEVVRSMASEWGETRGLLLPLSVCPPPEERSHELATPGVMLSAADAAPSANERPLLGPRGTGLGGHAQAVQLRHTRLPHEHGGPTHALPALLWRARHGAHTSSW